MKKLFSILAILAVFTVSAQNTAPRFGIPPGDDNTGRSLTYAVISTTDLAQATLDTITIAPNAYETLVCMKTGTAITNLSDSVCYKFSSTSTALSRYRLGDNVTISITKGTGAGKIKFGGSQYLLSTASAAVAIAANKTLVMTFIWNGQKWVEATRVVTP